MNWLMIVVILLIALRMVAGYRKGLLRVLYSLTGWVLVMLFVSWASPYVADFIMEQTAVADYIESRCVENLKSAGEEQAEGIAQTDLGGKLESLGLALPDSVSEKLFDSSEEKLDSAFSAAGNRTEEMLEQSGVYELIARKVATLIVNGIAYVLTLIAALVVFGLLGHALGLFNRIPLLGGINQSLGFVAGSVEGLIWVWIAFAVVAVCAGTGWGRFVTAAIAESPLLVWLYQNNLLVIVLLAFL